MGKKKKKKLWMALGISISLLVGMSTVVLAAEHDRTVMNETKETFPAPSYLKQTGADTTSVSLKWEAVSGAAGYQVELSSDGGNSYRILGQTTRTSLKITDLKADKKYAVRIFAYSDADRTGYTSSIYVWTAPKKPVLSSYVFGGNGCTFQMKNPGVNVDGYKVAYKNYKTGGSAVKYVPGRESFSIPFSGGRFYKVTITPYVMIDNQRYCGSGSITTYVCTQPKLQRKSFTNSSMTVKWPKCYGASSYSVYLKKPGASSFSKTASTTACSYTVRGMKIGSDYQIRVVANKKVGSKTYQSEKRNYYTIRLYYTYR